MLTSSVTHLFIRLEAMLQANIRFTLRFLILVFTRSATIDAFCAIWHKGLRRIWNLPHATYCALLPLLCGLLPLMDELACRSATFVNGCLSSDCDVVNFVARHGVYYRRMLSPIGRNSLFCCRRFGVRLSAVAHINKSFVWAHYQSQLSVSYCRTVYLLLELLFVKFGNFSVSCLSQADITYAVDSICISLMCDVFTVYVIFVLRVRF